MFSRACSLVLYDVSLNGQQSVLQNDATSEATARANRFGSRCCAAIAVVFLCSSVAASEAFDAQSDLCQRNFEASCPDGYRFARGRPAFTQNLCCEAGRVSTVGCARRRRVMLVSTVALFPCRGCAAISTGACAAMQSFVGYAALEKSKYAKSCAAPWPCQGVCSTCLSLFRFARVLCHCLVQTNALQAMTTATLAPLVRFVNR